MASCKALLTAEENGISCGGGQNNSMLDAQTALVTCCQWFSLLVAWL
jgi:hypothetical protein